MGQDSRRNPIATQMAAPPARVRDHIGKVLEVGDEVVVVSPQTHFRIASIRPLLQPGAPPNTMEVQLYARIAVACPRDQGIQSLYVLRHQAEIGDQMFPAAAPDAPDMEAPAAPADSPTLPKP